MEIKEFYFKGPLTTYFLVTWPLTIYSHNNWISNYDIGRINSLFLIYVLHLKCHVQGSQQYWEQHTTYVCQSKHLEEAISLQVQYNMIFICLRRCILRRYITPEKQLCVLQFSAHEALYVVVNVGQINMTQK